MNKTYYIYIISDSVGETAEHIARATAEQFRDRSYEIKKYSYIGDNNQAAEIIDDASTHDSIVIFTTVLESLKNTIVEKCKAYDILYIDVMSPLLKLFENYLGFEPMKEPGVTHKLDENYFKKVEAVEFAVKYDDGKDPRGVKKADIVVIGVSRTSKTPLSMYLAHKNLKVANIPLVPEVPVPEELYQIDSKKVIGLTTNPIKLNEIRQERLKALGLGNNASYASLDRILEELDYADDIMKRIGCPVIDVSSKAVEETANIIIEIMKDN